MQLLEADMAFRAVGSIWGKWDLHFHTPASFDYSKKNVTNKEVVDGLVAADVELVAITDHHVIDVTRIQELQKLGGDKLTVLPGIEFRSELGGNEAVHYIGIFPEDADVADLWTKLSGKLEITVADALKKGDDKIYIPFMKGAETIRELGGIVTVHAGKKSNSIENIGNTTKFKMEFKADLAKTHIDILELGHSSDQKAYEEKVFAAIGHRLPLIMGSDNHDIMSYQPKTACWVKGDPTFHTFQQLLSDPHRAFIGDEPPEKVRIATHPTKYIDSIQFKKVAGSRLIEEWFDGTVSVNPGLVAIIGNKGSGKTALAEALGLLGNCESAGAFSFLSPSKFRQTKNNKAREFEATMTWRNGHPVVRKLSDSTNPDMPRDVSYIPQSYLEVICNEVNNIPGSQFDLELKSVIFSHVAEHKKLNAESLGELIQFKTEPLEEQIETLRGELHEINGRILELESRSSAANRQLLLNLKASKEREVDAHDILKPIEVVKPEADPAQQAAMEAIGQNIAKANTERDALQETIRASDGAKKTAAAQVASAARVVQLLQNFNSAHQTLLRNLGNDCKVLGIDAAKLVTVVIDKSAVTAANDAAAKVLAEQDAKIITANTERKALKETIDTLTEQLDAPNSTYQKYTEALREWTERRAELVGEANTRDSLSYVEAQIKELDDVPNLLMAARTARVEKVKEIFAQIEAIVAIYRELYHPVQEFILCHPVAKKQFQLEFDASIIALGWEEIILGKVDKGRKGSFCGVEDSKRALQELIEQANLQTSDGVTKFCGDLLERFESDHRTKPFATCSLGDQLRSGVEPVVLLDAIFGLSYLVPKYQLKWAGKSIDELSPGERGTLLLIFYLLIDRRDVPLIIDQPEDNLDNQTVYDMLVACLREARSRRQVIIVTHNPNLAVVCDADQIIHSQIDKQNNRNKVTYTAGSLENPVTNRLCITVLEGTRPAFVHREQKYQSDT
jgi:ABC-type lipoprotein export system ATPase subunit